MPSILVMQLHILVLLSAALLSAASAVGSEPAPERALSSSRPESLVSHRPWVWEVETSQARLWIVGCLHLGTSSDTTLFPSYLPYYRQASTIYFETVPGASNSHDVRQLIARRGFLADRQTMAARVSQETWQKLTAMMSPHPKRLAAIKVMEPWLAAFTLIQDGYARAGLTASNSLGTLVQNLALQDNKPIGALETCANQILAMADASRADQENFLRETLNCLEKLETSTQTLRAAWASGNPSHLQTALGLDSAAARSGMHRNLIDKRNQQWVAQIKKVAQRRKDCLIVVGVEHLVAVPSALPDLLKEAGFKVRRVLAQSQTPP